MGQGDQRGDVGVDHRRPVLQAGALRRRGALGKTGIVDQQVDVTEGRRQGQQRRFHRDRITHVEHGRVHHLLAVALDQRLQAFAATAGGDHFPARLGEAVDGSGAEAGGGAGNQDGSGHQTTPWETRPPFWHRRSTAALPDRPAASRAVSAGGTREPSAGLRRPAGTSARRYPGSPRSAAPAGSCAASSGPSSPATAGRCRG
ncbi:hypothetical protein D3C81_752830 [compost metagenome]